MAVKAKETVTIKPITEKTAIIRVVGDTPLIVHKWSEKMKRALPAAGPLVNTDGIASSKKTYPSPMESFIDSMYWISGKPTEYTEEAFTKAIQNGARFGFRVESFKQAAIDAAYSKKWIANKKGVRGLFFLEPDFIDEDGYQLVEIKGCVPEMREDIVLLSGISRSPDLRWRGQFSHWYCDLKVTYDVDGIYTLQDICNMIHAGGRYNGVGEYRPEKSGQFGMFHVASSDE